MQKVINFKIRKGPKFALEIAKEETDLTAEMLESYVIIPHWLV
jgi:phenylalanyl-tRNA synthetase alpha chain